MIWLEFTCCCFRDKLLGTCWGLQIHHPFLQTMTEDVLAQDVLSGHSPRKGRNTVVTRQMPLHNFFGNFLNFEKAKVSGSRQPAAVSARRTQLFILLVPWRFSPPQCTGLCPCSALVCKQETSELFTKPRQYCWTRLGVGGMGVPALRSYLLNFNELI